MSTENGSNCVVSNIISRLQRYEASTGPPGPMAQAITFRAFGAGTWSFDTALKRRAKLIVTLCVEDANRFRNPGSKCRQWRIENLTTPKFKHH